MHVFMCVCVYIYNVCVYNVCIYIDPVMCVLAYLYSAPQPLTKLMRMVHMRVSWYTASNP